MGCYICNGLGESAHEPSRDVMWRFLSALDPRDEEHGAAWVATDDGIALEYSVDGRLVYSRRDPRALRHMNDVPTARVLELWLALAAGDLAWIDACPWRDGNGFIWTEEKQRAMEAGEAALDRQFYDSLGAERPEVPCASRGCSRGAVLFSVLCRCHHFEQVRGKPCPFAE